MLSQPDDALLDKPVKLKLKDTKRKRKLERAKLLEGRAKSKDIKQVLKIKKKKLSPDKSRELKQLAKRVAKEEKERKRRAKGGSRDPSTVMQA